MRAEQPKRGKWCIWFYMCSSYVYAFHVLVRSCWQENHLDRLVSRFVASPLVHSPNGVATSFWEPVANRIGSRICALRWAADLSVHKNQVSDMVWDLCSAKQGPKRKNRWTQLTDMWRVAQGTLEGLFFLRNRMLFPCGSVHQESSQWRRWASWRPQNVLTWSAPKCEPKT